ncbi:lps biosynthesis rfbU related protein [Thermococcus sp. 4557]|uniref:glycosyltransferase family 4 protein n=1 Tax=Thermococcus sp. (strain CGMCC 1.5172 / 4557) TaxID=1042877 RepID=UPI000219EF4F|nr:glycosyltransferase family 4 protein [Thermococcus sp. 4557]AEK73115.1 lps biosynthesis rfbU related protein [Thermococcus sp. 4557]
MRIAFIYDALYPEVKGGVERRLYELGKRLARKHEVHWYTFGWWGGRGTIERDGITIHGLGKPVELYRGGVRSPLEALQFSLRVLMGEVDSYDVVDCQEFPYLHAYPSRLRFGDSAAFVVTWHEYWGDYWGEYIPVGSSVGRAIERNLLRLTENHLAVSMHTLDRLKELARLNFGFVPNGIDFGLIRSVEPHPELRYDAVFVGRLIEHKNVGLLLEALRIILRDVPLFRVGIVGDGPMRGELERMARELGVEKNVDFLGFLPSFEEVVSVVKSSRVFAFPSIREGFGIAVLEANAAGVPAVVVSAPMNASADLIIAGRNGHVSDPTPVDFARKLLLVWEDSHRMRRPSVSYARGYDWDNVANQLERYYKGVANGA